MYIVRVPANTSAPIKLHTVTPRRKVHFLVLTTGRTCVLATERNQIESPPPFLGTAGLQISDTTGTVEIEWGGDIWVRSNGANTLDMQYDAG